jgi:hypothetical protein
MGEWELRRFEEKWEELIREQATLSKKSELRFAKGSGHSVFLDRPDVLIDSVLNMIEDPSSGSETR